MDVVCFLVALLAVISYVNCVFLDIEFLKDFFRGRNVVITANTCWSYGKYVGGGQV